MTSDSHEHSNHSKYTKSQIKPFFQLNPIVSRMKVSATLRMSMSVKQERANGKDVVNFGLGESPFGPPLSAVEELNQQSYNTSYLPTEGISELRENICKFYAKYFQIESSPEQVVIGPGSKELIFNVMFALDSPWLFSSPSWVTYETQAKMAGRDYRRVYLYDNDGFRLRENELRKRFYELDDALSGKTLAMLINYPNNPTGMTLSKHEVRKIARFARNNEIILLSDEIYGNITHPSFEESHHSLALEYPEGTIVTGGISKDRSMGGWRLGVAIFPEQENGLIKAMKAIGSETYTSVSAPIQYASIKAYELTDDVHNHIIDSTQIHGLVGNLVYKGLIDGDYSVNKPEGAFYMMPSLNKHKDLLNDNEIYTSQDLAENLLQLYGVAVIPGTAFGLRPENLSFRLAYIDYNGPATLKNYRKNPEDAIQDDSKFVAANCPKVLQGVYKLTEFVRDLKDEQVNQ